MGEFVARMVNNPDQRHPVAQAALADIRERLRSQVVTLRRAQEERRAEAQPLTEQRDQSLGDINRYARETVMRLIPGATRHSIDEKKDKFIELARHGNQNALEAHASAAVSRNARRIASP